MNEMVRKCLDVEFEILNEDKNSFTVLVRWCAKFKAFVDGKEHARIINKRTSDFNGTLDEALGRQRELGRKFRNKEFEIWREEGVWKCRRPKKKKDKKQKQLF